jgi:type I restriction enzyme S subunit
MKFLNYSIRSMSSSKQNWHSIKLGDVAQYINGKAFKTSEWSDSGLPIIRIQNLNNPISSHNLCDLEVDDKFHVEPGDLLFAWSGTPGTSFGAHIWNGPHGLLNQHIFNVKWDNKIINKHFLKYLLNQTLNHFINSAQGAAGLRHVTKSSVEATNVYLPSLQEQKRIVEHLDVLMEKIDKAQKKVEESFHFAQALFLSYLDNIFSDSHNGSIKLGDAADFRNGINFTKGSTGEEVEIVGVKDFKNNFWAPLDSLDKVKIDGLLPENDLLNENDLLFVRSNGNIKLIGRCMLIGDINKKATHSGFTIRARLVTNQLIPEFLCYYLKSSSVREQMISGGAGANIKSLNQTILSNIAVPSPSISKQKEIVQMIKKIEVESSQLVERLNAKHGYLLSLRASVLDSAFSGELLSK